MRGRTEGVKFMETRIYGKLSIDTDNIEQKVKAVIEAHEALRIAVCELERATHMDGIGISVEGLLDESGQK